MDTLSLVIISGMAVGYIIETLTSLTERWVPARLIRLSLTLPFSYLATWLLGLSGALLAVSGLAAAFFSLAVLLLLNKPATIQTINRMR
jgi:hypothetical protein